jgi:hypothetical protein
VVKSASEVAEYGITRKPDWFTESESLLLELIEKRKSTLKNYMKHGSTETNEILKQPRHNLKNEKKKAKREWQKTFAEKCQQEDFRKNPKQAWSMIFKLMEGFQGHHTNPCCQKCSKTIEEKLPKTPRKTQPT